MYNNIALVIIKSDNNNNFLILDFYNERSIINQCHCG